MSEKEEALEKAKKRISLELENDKRYTSFFAPYREDSVKNFIRSYASRKALLEVYGNQRQKTDQNIIEEWQQVAWECLEEIQHKKLFDLSCLWHAGKVKKIPEIDISMSFRHMRHRILDYKGISSISEEDINFYLRYINEENKSLGFYHHCDNYQEYERLKKHYKKHRNTGILYYDYHNKHTGNDQFLRMNAVKLEKEESYLKAAREKLGEKASVYPVKKPKPHLYSYEKDLAGFAKNFNDKKTAAYIESVVDFRENQQEDDTEWAINYLSQLSGDQVAVRANKNWLKALYEAAVEHRREKVKEVLPAIYEEYLLKVSTEIQFAPYDKIAKKYRFVERFKKFILDGREICGQPRNFDY